MSDPPNLVGVGRGHRTCISDRAFQACPRPDPVRVACSAPAPARSPWPSVPFSCSGRRPLLPVGWPAPPRRYRLPGSALPAWWVRRRRPWPCRRTAPSRGSIVSSCGVVPSVPGWWLSPRFPVVLTASVVTSSWPPSWSRGARRPNWPHPQRSLFRRISCALFARTPPTWKGVPGRLNRTRFGCRTPCARGPARRLSSRRRSLGRRSAGWLFSCVPDRASAWS